MPNPIQLRQEDMSVANLTALCAANGYTLMNEKYDNNALVRKMLAWRGIIPENLPLAEDVKKVGRRLASVQKKMLGKKKK